jgi:hypothetical protein
MSSVVHVNRSMKTSDLVTRVPLFPGMAVRIDATSTRLPEEEAGGPHRDIG